MAVEKRSTVQRRTMILEKLEANGQVNVTDLSDQFGVSEVTIRNDFLRLEKKNMLIRARGGAIKINRVGVDFELSKKHKINLVQKQKIGKRAAKLIQDGDTIIVDSGTTTQELVKNLSSEDKFTVITNALNIANNLVYKDNVQVVMIGGFLRKGALSMIGSPAETQIRNYLCDKLFLGVDGLNFEFGVSTPNIEEAHLNQISIEISRQIIVLADSSKIKKRSLAVICPISKIDILITDDGLLPEHKSKLEQLGVEVIIA
ncbi:MAG: DeoR/GlpR transcriptional regulator [Cyclobacteriaceae bacterium]|nr:DeoR/GlpR transcriptional regulator [Cyclobacteriaceae bacterium]MCK5280652.1 DeoR/GlpR transcriptional regulator [Cyclobacteriaceae bacterium]MCK5371437.1 DeoR/GlpR transcriptional regulator [Cyclobacteriaceae bacterium]MCK5467311.1 DeoR/GlpR transcriptional regulator [Cyclobacteriaceae bacterium]MCK5701769.1 DeoR/GlpR transcriptional regulator [Cyclobacteriaceae bacterium]